MRVHPRTLIGRKIVGVHWLDDEDGLDGMSGAPGFYLELDNKAVLVPLADEEGNGYGAIELLHPDDGDYPHGLIYPTGKPPEVKR